MALDSANVFIQFGTLKHLTWAAASEKCTQSMGWHHDTLAQQQIFDSRNKHFHIRCYNGALRVLFFFILIALRRPQFQKYICPLRETKLFFFPFHLLLPQTGVKKKKKQVTVSFKKIDPGLEIFLWKVIIDSQSRLVILVSFSLLCGTLHKSPFEFNGANMCPPPTPLPNWVRHWLLFCGRFLADFDRSCWALLQLWLLTGTRWNTKVPHLPTAAVAALPNHREVSNHLSKTLLITDSTASEKGI